MNESDIVRFWSKAGLRDEGCWLWTGYCNKKGYGQFHIGSRIDNSRKMVIAHRVAYELTHHDPIPLDKQIDHLCRTRACVRPSHLEVVTSAENNRRGLGGKINNFNAHKTHCKRGHPFDLFNTLNDPRGFRVCRMCLTIWNVKRNTKRKLQRLGRKN